MPNFKEMLVANGARQKEWDTKNQIDLAFRGNELAGEVGEALERAVDLLLLSVSTGKANNHMKKLQRERLGIKGSRSTKKDLEEELSDVIICVGLIAMHEGLDMDQAVVAKFNATSEKMGLQTRLE